MQRCKAAKVFAERLENGKEHRSTLLSGENANPKHSKRSPVLAKRFPQELLFENWLRGSSSGFACVCDPARWESLTPLTCDFPMKTKTVKNKTVLSTIALIVFCFGSVSQAQDTPTIRRAVNQGPRFYQLPGIETKDIQTAWGIIGFAAVPDLLRRHLPDLHPGQGLLVAEVRGPNGLSFAIGDILISIDGQKITQFDSLPKEIMHKEVIVIRNGKVLNPSPARRRAFQAIGK